MVLMLLTLAACGVNAQNDDMYLCQKEVCETGNSTL